MNREIKFRGKSKQDNVFVYGSYVRYNDSRNNPFKNNYKETHQILAYFPGDWNMGGCEYVDVYPETVGQYTGLKDKNGVEIYEGDIMNDPTSKSVGIVEWNNILTQFQLSWQNMPTTADIFFMVKNGSLVIGNIHDNPELINRKEKK